LSGWFAAAVSELVAEEGFELFAVVVSGSGLESAVFVLFGLVRRAFPKKAVH
jgi:hypothetical protein